MGKLVTLAEAAETLLGENTSAARKRVNRMNEIKKIRLGGGVYVARSSLEALISQLETTADFEPAH